MFEIAATDARYAAAIGQLKQITDTLATDLVAHESHMQFVAMAAQAVDAVLKGGNRRRGDGVGREGRQLAQGRAQVRFTICS